MPIIAGVGLSYSPLLYRERSAWTTVSKYLRGDAIQPKSAEGEDDAVLDAHHLRITRGFAEVEQAIARSNLEALILISADRGSQFDASHVPQIHLRVGGEVWGDSAIGEIGEAPARVDFRCEATVADLLIEELVREGFDVAEGRGAFQPVGDPARGLAPAATEAAARLAGDLPIIPISINCHVAPVVGGGRLQRFGVALARAAALSPARLGLLVSGGLSGDPQGSMAGWIDELFDLWLLRRIARGQSDALARIWDAGSRLLLGSTAEVRLWTMAAAALDEAGCTASVHDYLPVHHAAAGIAFVTWER